MKFKRTAVVAALALAVASASHAAVTLGNLASDGFTVDVNTSAVSDWIDPVLSPSGSPWTITFGLNAAGVGTLMTVPELTFALQPGYAVSGLTFNFGGTNGNHAGGIVMTDGADGDYTTNWSSVSGTWSTVYGPIGLESGVSFAGASFQLFPNDTLVKPTYAYATFSVVSAVPEPETAALMLAGLGCVGALAGRRKQQKRINKHLV